MTRLRVVLVKASKYAADGSVERFRKAYLPNATLYHIASLTPDRIGDVPVVVQTVDEFVHDDLEYLDLLRQGPDEIVVMAAVGVQSHQLHRALDLAAYAREHGVRHCIIGGAHPMTCDTSPMHDSGVSFSLAEAELIWLDILRDAIDGQLQPVYGAEQRWAEDGEGAVIRPPGARDLERYGIPLLGIYPSRGCPYKCDFCSVIKLAGRAPRNQSIGTTMASLRRASDAGIRMIIFTADNFNKYTEVRELLQAMIDEGLDQRFICQCDTQIARQPELIELMGRAGCFEIFLGIESLNREQLKEVSKYHNQPENYGELVKMCAEAGILSHFSSILGFESDTEESVAAQVEGLIELDPDKASFNILVPIPGTEQYDDFRRRGLIYEMNLDRFDAACPTWHHPNLSAQRLRELLFESYARFYRAALKSDRMSVDRRIYAEFSLYCAANGMQPMAGGFPVVRDGVSDYIDLRRKHYGFDLAPLPDSLPLSPADEARNARVKWNAPA